MDAGALAGLHARFGSDQQIAPIVEIIGLAGRRRAAGVRRDLGQRAVADTAVVVLVGGHFRHVAGRGVIARRPLLPVGRRVIRPHPNARDLA